MQAGPDVDQFVRGADMVFMQSHCDLPLTFAQHRLQFADGSEIGGDVIDLPLVFQGLLQAFQIAGGFVHIGLFDLDKIQLSGRVHGDVAHSDGFADHLFVDLAFGWNINDDIALHGGLTAQPAAGFQPALVIITLFDGIPFRQRIAGHVHTVLGKLPIGRGHLTFRADAASAADRIQVDAKLARSRQHGGANGKMPTLARGGEYHQRNIAHMYMP